MKRFLACQFLPLFFCAITSAEVITNGVTIGVARKAMEAAGYKETGLDMAAEKPSEALQFWDVDQGVLIIWYSKASKKILGVTYWLSDERSKAYRKTFEFQVTSFDSKTGTMTLKTGKSEPMHPADGIQPSRDKPNSTPAAAGSRR